MNTCEKTENKTSWETQSRTLPPKVDIYEGKDAYVLEAEMPGVSKDGLEVLLEGNQLTLIGHRSPNKVSGQILYQESKPRDFCRVFELDPVIDTGKIQAQMDQGILKVHLPKAESVKPRRIAVTE